MKVEVFLFKKGLLLRIVIDDFIPVPPPPPQKFLILNKNPELVIGSHPLHDRIRNQLALIR